MIAGEAEQRLAAIYAELERIGLRALVMGGHAVRFYGVDRSTIDYDLAIALPEARWDALPDWRAIPRVTAPPRRSHISVVSAALKPRAAVGCWGRTGQRGKRRPARRSR